MGHALQDYAAFIIFPIALFSISGGIYVSLSNHSTPVRNLLLLIAGALLTNLFGTTGASLLLIRPYLRTNKYRLSPFHLVFFIFIISNAGGTLTPIGQAPLFMGYIKGVPFFWSVEKLWLPWLMVNCILLLLFYIFDTRNYAHVRKSTQNVAERHHEKLTMAGLHNLAFLAITIAALFIDSPRFLREAIWLAAAAGSYFSTKKEIHTKNQFNFIPMKEVAIIFFGIFITMAPALEWLETNAATMNLQTPGHYFWITGVISSFLDNAPTYLSFLAAAMGSFGMHINDTANVTAMLQQHPQFVIAISLGAVFFGATTYIGNAPNFFVKSIAEHNNAPLPNFGKYIAYYAVPILLPIFALMWWLFV